MNRLNRHLGNLGTCGPCSAMPLFGDAAPAPAPIVPATACDCGTAKLALVALGGVVVGALVGPMIRKALNI